MNLSLMLVGAVVLTAPTPGLHLTVDATLKDGKTPTDHRPARLIALHVPTGTPPSIGVPAGPFRATWRGNLELELKGDYTFSAEGNGTFVLLLNGEKVLDCSGDDFRKTAPKKIELKRENTIEARYESPANKDATVRLFWSNEDFPREPFGMNAVTHDLDNATLVAGRRLREGRDLLAAHLCIRCHQASGFAMPELERDAPSLADLGTRLKRDWVARWVQDPQALRPGATMPRLLAKAETGLKAKLHSESRDIAAFLSSLGKAPLDKEKADEKAVLAGTRLFVNLGCYGCHTDPGKDEYAEDEHRRIPLRDVGAKYHPSALRAFLRKPEEHFAWVRMPNFRLTEQEASNLAAYLLSAKPRDLGEAGGGNGEEGKKLVAALGCVNCHALTSGKPEGSTLKSPAFAALEKALDRGCLSAKPERAPVFPLTDDQRTALKACVRASDTLKRDVPQEFVGRQIASLRCNACHKRDGADDLMSVLKDEAEGLVADFPPEPMPKEGFYTAEQVRPPLTWIGEKLKPEWTRTLFEGKLPYKPRPWLRSRMPSFAVRADLLSRGLSQEHGYAWKSPDDPKPDAKLADAGRNLASKMRWGCVGCHDVGKVEAIGVFEAPGVNFMVVKDRMRRDFFDRWLWAPLRVEPGTKMPTVYNVGQPSQIKDVLDGDSQKQIDALWNYLLLGEKITQ